MAITMVCATAPNVSGYLLKKKVTVTIDCFEVIVNRPSNLYTRAQTFSSHKNHNTVKVLIGITPQGSICFVLQKWGGRTSDKFIGEKCCIVKKILPRDLVLADRGHVPYKKVSCFIMPSWPFQRSLKEESSSIR